MSDVQKDVNPAPCPFCGKEPVISYEACWWFVKCTTPSCECRMSGFCSERMAIAAWNRRAAVPSPCPFGEFVSTNRTPDESTLVEYKETLVEVFDSGEIAILDRNTKKLRSLPSTPATADKPEAGKVDVLQSKADFFQKKGEMLQRSVERLRFELSTAQASLKCADHKIELLEDALKKQCWCAYCGKFGDHQSGWCLQLKLDKAQASLNQANERIEGLEEQKAEAFGYARDMEKASSESDQKLLQAQAEAAAYRKALEMIAEFTVTFEAVAPEVIEVAKDALKGTSANALIERLKAYEEIVELVRPMAGYVSGLPKLLAALKLAEKGGMK